MTHPQLVWFKRDLRIHDHAPLYEAAQAGPVVALYVYEPEVFAAPEAAPGHVCFLNQCLKELRASLRGLGADLIVRHGEVIQVFDALHEQIGFEALWSHEETGLGITYQRDRRVAAWAKSKGVQWHERAQYGVFRPHPDRNGWARRWAQRMKKPILGPPEGLVTHVIEEPGEFLTPETLGLGASEISHAQAGGESAGRETLVSFLGSRAEPYQKAMSSPLSAWDHCSRLSPHIAYGTLSIKEISQRTRNRRERLKAERAAGKNIGPSWLKSLASFEKRLRWHCHFMQKLEDQPSIEHTNMARFYDGIRSETPNPSKLDAGSHGYTGYPMVDACMRALRQTGWINFRMRAMLMSFGSYHLWLHWRPTALHLARYFTDFEAGIHYSQAQMQSGTTGINAVRIYSPTKQAKDQDPTGEFIRTWVPELASVPTPYIAEPATMPLEIQHQQGCIIGKDYPAPIVNHQQAVKEAKSKVYKRRRTPEGREEAARVYRKHGSRRRPQNRRKARTPKQTELPLSS